MKRKTKSMAQLLKEFPGAQFEEDGDLGCQLWKGQLIITEMFIELGREIELSKNNKDNRGNVWLEEWLEPLPRVREGRYIEVTYYLDSRGEVRMVTDNRGVFGEGILATAKGNNWIKLKTIKLELDDE